MQCRKFPALIGATVLALLALGGTALAGKASSPAVTVRVEGLNKTLLRTTVLHAGSGWITRYGAPKGQCPGSSVQGALDVATRHRWKGTWSTKFGPEYEITSILGETHTFSSKDFWEIFVNNVPASAGACELSLHAGDQLLFAAVPDNRTEYPLGLVVSRHVVAGHPFKVKVVSFTARGKTKPLAGATVTLGAISAEPIPHSGSSAKTNSKGIATLTQTRLGLAALGASKNGYIRAAAVTLNVT